MATPRTEEEVLIDIERTEILIEGMEHANSCCQYHHDLGVRFVQPMKDHLAGLQALLAVSKAKAH